MLGSTSVAKAEKTPSVSSTMVGLNVLLLSPYRKARLTSRTANYNMQELCSCHRTRLASRIANDNMQERCPYCRRTRLASRMANDNMKNCCVPIVKRVLQVGWQMIT